MFAYSGFLKHPINKQPARSMHKYSNDRTQTYIPKMDGQILV